MEKKQPSLPRWKYRFDNYSRAYRLLSEAVDFLQENRLSQLEKEGTIQRFEYCWELSWQLMADYLADQGINLPTRVPKQIIRAALEADIIKDGQAWMDSLDDRNKMSHRYSEKVFDQVIKNISGKYRNIFGELYLYFGEKRHDQG